jgi:lysophospholipase L1-like esterase
VAFCSFANAIATGDWSVAETGAASGGEGMESFPVKVAKLKEINWNKVDYITLAYGANDITADANDSIIDNEDDLYNTHTFLGAFRHSYESIIAKYPHIRFMVCTPIYHYFKENGEFTIDSDDKMFAGETEHYYAWGDALIELCKEYKIPYLDLYRTLGINKFNRDYYFADETGRSDGVHPNANGCKIMGDAISGGLLSHY